MPKKIHVTPHGPAAMGPYSIATEANGFVFCSGMVPLVPETGAALDGDVAASGECAGRVSGGFAVHSGEQKVEFDDVRAWSLPRQATPQTPLFVKSLNFSNKREKYGSDPQQFADAAIEVYTDAARWSQVQAQGQRIARARFDAAEWLPRLPQLLEASTTQLTEHRKQHFTGRMLRHHHHRSTEFMSRWIEAKNQ